MRTPPLDDIVSQVDSPCELNKRKIRLFVEAVWNEGRLELIDELVADDYIGRVSHAGREILGPEGLRRLVSSGRRAHPGLYVKIDDQIAEDDLVATRWRAMTSQPGSAPCYAGISLIRLLAGLQVDSHTEYAKFSPGALPRLAAAR